MWYYSVIWLTIGALQCFLEWLNYGYEYSFWGVAISIPTIIWLFKTKK